MRIGSWVVGALLLVAGAAAAVPAQMNAQGRLVSAGGLAVDGVFTIKFSLHDGPQTGSALWTETQANVVAKEGVFNTVLGQVVPLDADVFAATPSLWLEVKLNAGPGVAIGGDAPLPRTALTTVAYAFAAARARGLQGVGCVSEGELDFQVATDAELSQAVSMVQAMIPTSVNNLTGGTIAGAVVSTSSISGVILRQNGAVVCDESGNCGPTLGDLVCQAGDSPEFDGLTWGCAPGGGTITQEMMPPNGLNEVSNNLLTNQFTDSAQAGPIDIKDNFPPGVVSTITFPDVGSAEALTISINLGNSDLSGVRASLSDPAFNEYVLFDFGQLAGTQFATTYPVNATPKSGNLGYWVGRNPKGPWTLTIVDNKFKDQGLDGKVNLWSVAIQTLSSKKVQVNGTLEFGAGAHDDLTAQDVAILTGGPQSDADSLHTHVGENQKLDELVASLTALREQLAPTTCPADMKLGGKPGTESAFCIEPNRRGGSTYHNAVNTCMALGRHVCTQNQWWHAASTVSGMNGMCDGNWEWVGDRDEAHTSGHLQVVIGGNGCTIQSWAWAGQHANGNGGNTYRCCLGGLSSIFD